MPSPHPAWCCSPLWQYRLVPRSQHSCFRYLAPVARLRCALSFRRCCWASLRAVGRAYWSRPISVTHQSFCMGSTGGAWYIVVITTGRFKLRHARGNLRVAGWSRVGAVHYSCGSCRHADIRQPWIGDRYGGRRNHDDSVCRADHR